MTAEQDFPLAHESEAELATIHETAANLGVKLDEVLHSGSQGTTIGVRAKSVMVSQRLDSRTWFVHDTRLGAEAGVLEAEDGEHIRLAHAVAEKLHLPKGEIANASVQTETTQAARFDLHSGQAHPEPVVAGKRFVEMSRAVEGVPVWSSRLLVSFTKERGIGFLEAHWPEIPQAVLAEARRLAARVKEGFKPPERPHAKPIEVEAGIIHSPAAGFVMDIYPAIRVIYAGSRSGYKRAVAYLDRHGRDVPVPRQFDMAPEAANIARHPGHKPGAHHARDNFRALKLGGSELLKGISLDTSYEELGCVGYNPEFRRIEAVVYIKRHTGYGGGLCGAGSREYVRFYLSFDDGATWEDQGDVSFVVWDLAFDGARLEYAVNRDIAPYEAACTRPRLPIVRAILSWNDEPPPNTPNFPPHWGNVRDARIQIGAAPSIILSDLVDVAKLPDFATLIDPAHKVPLLEKSLSATDLVAAYRGKGVPEHRFLSAEIANFIASPAITTQPAIGIDWSKVIPGFLAGSGDTTYEQLDCIGYDALRGLLVGVVHLKLPNGYSGGLCSRGSPEYLAFWVDWGDGGGFHFVGTGQVRVHDIPGIPLPGGLYYAAFVPFNPADHRRPCGEGPIFATVRAVLSWNSEPNHADPDQTPRWGNRLDTRVHILPGVRLGVGEPFLWLVGDVPYDHINAAGRATGHTIITNLHVSDSPFGGRVTLAGFIGGATTSTRYRIMRRRDDEALFTPYSNPFEIKRFDSSGALPEITVTPDGAGYYAYYDVAPVHVADNLIGVWDSTGTDHGHRFEIRIDVAVDADPVHDIPSNGVNVLVDNRAPDALLSLDLGVGGECADFLPGAIINGHFTATDANFGGFSFTILPTGPAHGVLPVPASGSSVWFGGAITDPGLNNATYTINTGLNAGPPPTGPMDRCGYALLLTVADRTNVDSGMRNNSANASVGFCIRLPD